MKRSFLLSFVFVCFGAFGQMSVPNETINEDDLKKVLLEDFWVFYEKKIENTTTEIKKPKTLVGEGLKLENTNSITIYLRNGRRHEDLRILVSKSKKYSDGFSELNPVSLRNMRTSTGYQFDFLVLKKLGIVENGKILRIESDYNNFEFEVTMIDIWQYGSLPKSPVLYIFNGNLGNFNLANFSPSLSITIVRRNFDFLNFDYISFDPIFSYSIEDNEIGKYSAILGADLGFGGWIQLGYVYHFGRKEAFPIIGIRAESLIQNFMKAIIK